MLGVRVGAVKNALRGLDLWRPGEWGVQMRIAWDCRSVAEHMGGIGQATVGWLREFLRAKPAAWQVVTIFSAINTPEFLERLIPGLTRQTELHLVEAGMVAPQFDQLQLPCFLQAQKIEAYFNTSFTLPAVQTTRFQVSVVHDVVFLDRPQWVDPQLAQYLLHGTDLSLRRADRVLTVSQFSKSRIDALGPDRQWERAHTVEVLHPPLPPKAAKMPAGIAAEVPGDLCGPHGFLLYLGSMEEKKGIAVLLDAYAQLVHARRDQTPLLVLAGGQGGKQFDLQAALRSRNLLRQTRVLGFVPEAVKQQLMRKARIFLFPSQYEGFGIPPLEAMAFGTPVIAARATSLPEILGDAALLAEPAQAGEWVAAMEELLDHPQRCAELSKRGTVRAKKFAQTKTGDQLVKLFRQLERAA